MEENQDWWKKADVQHWRSFPKCEMHNGLWKADVHWKCHTVTNMCWYVSKLCIVCLKFKIQRPNLTEKYNNYYTKRNYLRLCHARQQFWKGVWLTSFFSWILLLNKRFTILYIKVEKVPLGRGKERRHLLLMVGLQTFEFMVYWREHERGIFLENCVLISET